MTAAVADVRSARPIGPAIAEPNGATPSLLPPPSETELNPGQAMIALQHILLKMRAQSEVSGKSRIDSNERLAQKAIKDAAEAEKKQREAENEDGGFFDGLFTAFKAVTVDLAKFDTLADPIGSIEEGFEKAGDATVNNRAFMEDLEKGALEVGKWAAVAGSVALAVCSCGAAAPIAALAIVGAVASCAAAADSTFGIMEKLGVDKDTAMWIDVGLSIGGAVCSGGAGIGMALGNSASAVNTAVRTGAIIADGAAGASTVVGAAAKMRVAKFDEQAKLAAADVQEAQQTQQRIERRIQALLDTMKDALESHGRGLKRVGEAMTDFNATRVAIVRA